MTESINWPDVHKRILGLQQRDSKNYTRAGYVMIVLALIMLFIFPFGSLIVLGLAIYLFYNAHVNRKKLFAFIINGVVQKKECYYYLPREPDAADPQIPAPSLFLLQADKITVHKTNPNGITAAPMPWASPIKVNSLIYAKYKPGDIVVLIMSPVKDLIGFVIQNEVTLLITKVGGREYALTIPQTIDLRDAILFKE